MPLTKSEKFYLLEIEKWEQQLYDYEPSYAEIVYKKWMDIGIEHIPESTKESIMMLLDSSLFHIHSILFNSTFQKNTSEKILQTARLYKDEIFILEEMCKLKIDQLNFIAKEQIGRYQMLAFSQGCTTGIGSSSLLITDLLGILLINLRSIQVIASIYGRPAHSPYEIMTVLKVFHSACLPRESQGEAWNELMEDLVYKKDYFYKGKEEIVDERSFLLLVKQSMKLLFIYFFSKKFSTMGIMVGGVANYQFTKKITEFTHKYYQKSYLLLKDVEEPLC
ncbi:EcsC family protein [Niallia sp. 03133]|uniref:EcsC family protein n=1 Tax=Niallia sp. 03133 TaxID=3458060 RepID=UPI004044C469